MPEEIEKDMVKYTGCISRASFITELESMIRRAGFENIRISPKNESKTFIREWIPGSRVEDYVVSATIEAVKPQSDRAHL
jgi:hypothetical protein